ncbi:MAG: mechanosensitive ion channel family protein, partial [Gemmatimonadetes bacterium]|nr:mechanosensitive ion channel family protein [Gemmatimonadota bacterium]NIQ58143.1 mechanosensitive ion channel family protein [Gemmatimonadota bacterium]NIU78347.1 mechanosensitive ion channel family protein [Gammaproteobacteria bacterium]NIX40391.1 mechanosensitive ion channel family protein [Gemmatimonadota bacterium]NIX47290.1 mechanosensitive ion channel family protein [Gemmatimonadota bacterium]
EELTAVSPGTQMDIALSGLLILVVMAARALALRIMRSRVEDVRIRYRWRKTITYISVVVAILLVGRVWSGAFGELATFLGLLSAGLAIA